MTTLALQRAEAPVSATSADQPFRTATGGLIDRNRPRDFSFDGGAGRGRGRRQHWHQQQA